MCAYMCTCVHVCAPSPCVHVCACVHLCACVPSLCVCTYVHVYHLCVRTCVHVYHLCACTCVHVYHLCVSMRVRVYHLCVHACTCVPPLCACVRTCEYVCVHVWMCICVCTCVGVYVYLYLCMHAGGCIRVSEVSLWGVCEKDRGGTIEGHACMEGVKQDVGKRIEVAEGPSSCPASWRQWLWGPRCPLHVFLSACVPHCQHF